MFFNQFSEYNPKNDSEHLGGGKMGIERGKNDLKKIKTPGTIFRSKKGKIQL